MLNLKSYWNDVYRVNVTVDNTDLLDPTADNPLEPGEWLVLDPATGKYGRSTNPAASPVAYQVISELGAYPEQALSKTTIIHSRDYEAETDKFAGALSSYSIGEPLTLSQDATTGANILAKAATGNYVYGYVKGTSSDKLRFHAVAPYYKP